MKGPWIEVIEPERASGRLKEIYDETIKKRGQLAAIHKIHSLNPESLVGHMGLYLTLMFGKSPLARRERELLGVAVSVSNGCKYCVTHHAEALSRYEKRADYLRTVTEGRFEDLEDRDRALCMFAAKLTRTPSAMAESDHVPLRAVGFEDAAILDTVQIVSYFNFVNRMVLSLGVQLEGTDQRQDYKY